MRTVYITWAELPNDDKTLRQAKSIVAYKHPAKRIVKAHWIDPSNKGHGVTVTIEDNA